MSEQISPEVLPLRPPAVPVPVMAYASPSYGTAPTGGVWRDGRMVVLYGMSELPDSCVKCGGPPQTRLTRKLTWFPPLAYLGLLGGILPFAIIAMITQKKATIVVPLCGEHVKKRKQSLLIAWSLVLLGLAIAIAGSMITQPAVMIPLGILVLIAGAVVGVIAVNPLKPKKIAPPYTYLKGACELFLNQMPDVRTPPPQPQ